MPPPSSVRRNGRKDCLPACVFVYVCVYARAYVSKFQASRIASVTRPNRAHTKPAKAPSPNGPRARCEAVPLPRPANFEHKQRAVALAHGDHARITQRPGHNQLVFT